MSQCPLRINRDILVVGRLLPVFPSESGRPLGLKPQCSATLEIRNGLSRKGPARPQSRSNAQSANPQSTTNQREISKEVRRHGSYE